MKPNAARHERRDQRAAVSQDEDAAALVNAARLSIASADFSAASRHADKLIEEFPRRADGFLLKSQALAGQERLREALETLRAGLDSNGPAQELLTFARNVAFRHGGIEAAAEFALELSEISPGDLKNELYVTDWFLASGNADAALERADALTDAFPGSPQAWVRKAKALLSKNRGEESLETLRKALNKTPENEKLLTLARDVALRQGRVRESKDYAVRLLELAPDDQKKRNFLVQTCLAAGDFEEALAHSAALVEDCPDDVRAVMLKCQALVALHQVREALAILRDAVEAHPNDRRLLRLARSIAFQNGRFDEATGYASRVVRLGPSDQRNKVFLVQCYMAAGRLDEVELFFSSDGGEQRGVLAKEKRYYDGFKRLVDTAPALASAWQLALENGVDRNAAPGCHVRELGATMIQYWSQGTPPDDVQIVCDNWRALFKIAALGRVELFDRQSALAWIRENAPEFVAPFSGAFHYAMESDIFRIAYASKRACIYMDIDSWPLEHTPAILRFAIEQSATMLYFRAHRPTIANGFFVSTPESPFLKKLVEECLAIDLRSMPKNYLTLEASFGPSRYGKVLADLVRSSGTASASMLPDVPGCSVVSLNGSEIYFAHEGAVASVRPPFPLGYKATGDYWKYISETEE